MPRWSNTSTCRCSTPARRVLKRMKRGASRRYLPEADRAHPHAPSPAWPSAPVSSPVSRAKRKPISNELCRVRRSRAVRPPRASSPTPTKTPAAAFALEGKVDGRTIDNRKRRLMAIQRKISRAPEPAPGGQRSAGAGGRHLPRYRSALAGAACPDKRPKSTASYLINDFEGGDPKPGPDAPAPHHGSARLRSGRHAAHSFRARVRPRHWVNLIHITGAPGIRHPEPDTGAMRCPICQRPVKLTDPDAPFCSPRCKRSTSATGLPKSTSFRPPLIRSRKAKRMTNRRSPAWLFATWFGCGYSPFAPGTVGSPPPSRWRWPLARAGFTSLWFLILSFARFIRPSAPPALWLRRPAGRTRRFVVIDEVLGAVAHARGRVTLQLADVSPSPSRFFGFSTSGSPRPFV